MSKIPFNVSARAARLIGRENVSNAEGAIIELVKNGYDADANKSIIVFENNYREIPIIISKDELDSLQKYKEDIYLYYEEEDLFGNYKLIETNRKNEALLNFFLSTNSIYIFDDGSGMSADTIKKAWMTIGTDHKALNYISARGRIRTGAKGIGRFALDRLGHSAVMWTLEENKKSGLKWAVDWGDFEKQDTVIGDVFADIEEISAEEFSEKVKEELFGRIDLSLYEEQKINELNQGSFNKGTLIKIIGLRDGWNDKSLNKAFSSLDSLIPPKEERIFDIYFFANKCSNLFGSVQSSIIADFDYKLEAIVGEDQEVTVTITRDELDLSKIDLDLFNNIEYQVFPYDKETIFNSIFTRKYTVQELLPQHDFMKLGHLKNLSFNFYFLKRDFDEDSKYGYKNMNAFKRKAWLDSNGGIRMYRDHFRVRPYGEINSASFDWLKLNERVQRSPAGVGNQKGNWHVRPNQVSGSIFISRSHIELKDLSNREGLQDNESFEIFQEFIVKIINIFERDRQKIMRGIKNLNDIKDQKEIIKQEGIKLAHETVKSFDNDTKSQPKQDLFEEKLEEKVERLEKDNLILAKSLITYDEVVEEKETELKLIKALAGTGIALTSLSHEIKHLSSPLVTRTLYLKELIDQRDYNEIGTFIDLMIEKDRALKGWLDVSLNIVSKDKRKRKSVNIYETLKLLLSNWKPSLDEKKITVTLNKNLNEEFEWKAFVIDIESIFNNLIINSLFAFLTKEHQGERKIEISISYTNNQADEFEIIYADTGPGLSKNIVNKNDIFEPFYTTRENGTGLGMWILKSTVEEYKGEVELVDSKMGFKLKMKFPI